MIRIGVNCISPQSFAIAKQLRDLNLIDFYELLVDNFIAIAATDILDHVGETPIALHIAASRLLEKPEAALIALGKHLKPWIRLLNPLYVSDHLIQFSEGEHRLAVTKEIDYAKQKDHLKSRVNLWQHTLESKIYFENYASMIDGDACQPQWFDQLCKETGAGLLFDFSNAHIAELNQVIPISAWENQISRTDHFHIGGFRFDEETQCFLDTHDRPLDVSVLSPLKTKHHFTLVVESENQMDLAPLRDELIKVKQIFHE